MANEVALFRFLYKRRGRAFRSTPPSLAFCGFLPPRGSHVGKVESFELVQPCKAFIFVVMSRNTHEALLIMFLMVLRKF